MWEDSITHSHFNSFLMISLFFWCPPLLPQRLRSEHHSAFKWNTDCFSCLFTTHGSAASHNLLFLPRTIWRISWIKMILIISQWKDPWQLWIPLEPDQRPLVPHLYGQSNSMHEWLRRLAVYTPLLLLFFPLIFPVLFQFFIE